MICGRSSKRPRCDGYATAVAACEPDDLETLRETWLVPSSSRLDDGKRVAELDEAFHVALVTAAGNPELARVHREVTERIRIIRRLDFTQAARVQTTYDEHGQILRAILERRADDAGLLLRAHIEASKAEVRKITLHCLHRATRDGRREEA